MRKLLIFITAAVAILLTATAVLILVPRPWSSGPSWEAVKAEVATGKTVLEVRLKGLGVTPPADGVLVTSTRLDMAPDGMAAMTAPVRILPSQAPGVVVLEAELPMAGRWALSITADVAGETRPVRGTVIFRATNDAAPSEAKSGRRIVYYRNPMGAPDVSTR